MYTPNHFKADDEKTLLEFMRKYSFATLISCQPEPAVTHLPLAVRGGPPLRLLGHVARANRHWQSFDGRREVLVIFNGPHAYVSPSLYENPVSVPTWNYAVVHAHGTPHLREDAGAVLEEVIEFYDPSYMPRWRALPDEYRERMKKKIVAFEVRVNRVEGKFKLSQDRTRVDRENIIRHFDGEAAPDLRPLGEMMRAGLDPGRETTTSGHR